jgi:hypothetical protein
MLVSKKVEAACKVDARVGLNINLWTIADPLLCGTAPRKRRYKGLKGRKLGIDRDATEFAGKREDKPTNTTCSHPRTLLSARETNKP